jgi:hypothetical protein
VLAISLAELGANPPAYEGLLLRLSGAYSKTALQACFPQKGIHPKWGMVGDDLLLNAIGYESVLGLMPANTAMTIEGIWRQYTGPLGCGKKPPTGTVWYLETISIVAPNPLPNFGVASSGEQGNTINNAPIVATPIAPATVDGTIATNQETPIPTPLPVGTPVTATPTSIIINPVSTATRPLPTPTLVSDPQSTATPTKLATATRSTDGSPTATNTVTPTSTPTKGGTTTPLPTETPPPSRTPVITSTPIPPQPTFTPGPYNGQSTPYP